MSEANFFGGAITIVLLIAATAVSIGSRARVGASLGTASGSRRSPLRFRRLAQLTEQLDWPFDPLAYPLLLAVIALIGGLGGSKLAGPIGGLIGAVGGLVAIDRWLRRRRSRRLGSVDVELRDAVSTLAAAARAGLTLRQSLEESLRAAGPTVRPHLGQAVTRMAAGESPVEAIDRLARDIGSADARLLAAVVKMHQRVGGELARPLDELAEVIGKRVEGRRRIRAVTAQGRASGAVLAVLPVAFVGLLSGTTGNGLSAFYSTPLGGALLGAGALLEVLGFLWIRAILRAA